MSKQASRPRWMCFITNSESDALEKGSFQHDQRSTDLLPLPQYFGI